MRARTTIAWAVLLATMLIAAPAHAAGGKLDVEALSSAPDLVTGDDALVAVTVPNGTKPSKVRVRLNGADVTSRFSDQAGSGRLVGLVDGLSQGQNELTAYAKGLKRPASLQLYDSPISGPLFSGPQQSPFFCRTIEAGLGAPTDANCSASAQVNYVYRTNGGDFEPLADPSAMPADGVQTTTRDGRTVDYVVRIETGVIDRSVYRWATLAPGGDVAAAWNQRLVYKFGGGCGAGYQQGVANLGQVLDDAELSQGYAILSGSLNVFNTACNDVLSAEAASMLKEHFIESVGAAPVWTIGEGSSGGSVQAQLIAQNYPGLLDGLLPSASFPDGAAPDYPDCRLLTAYYATPAGAALSNSQRQAISGLSNPNGCVALSAGADVVNASEGCDESVVPPAQIFDAATNPTGIRCTVWDSMVAVYGRDPATGFARRTLDNVGVQYGLVALQQGTITLNEFLDLNQGIGGYDQNGEIRAARSVGDPDAIAAAFRTGRVNQGLGGYRQVPVVDARSYVDDEANVHQYVNTYKLRARLDSTGGHGNQVMFRAKGGQNVGPMNAAALDLIGRWLDAIAADHTGASLAEKVLNDKPSDAVDACWTNGGQRTDAPAQIGASNICEQTYPPHSLPANQAGKPLDSIAVKCALRPLNYGDYGSPSAGQQARLAAIFPDGVCDWSKPGPGQQAIDGTWQEFGPQRVVTKSKPKLGLKAKRKGSGRRGTVALSAKLGPCPASGFQRIVFERKRKGKWGKVGTGVTSGKQCKAKVTLKSKRLGKAGPKPVKLRASFDAVGALESARSRGVKVKLR
ncbi:MAG: DUF6351 family protein [Solirubrobacterales bacterium]